MDHASTLSLFVHHAWIGSFLNVGCFTHLAILAVRREGTDSLAKDLVYHRDMVTGHLTWVVTLLGTHSFGLYVHNDSLLALNRSSNTFSDVSIRLFPLLPYVALQDTSGIVGLDIGTADFLVTHIHVYLSYNIIGLDKGIVYSRSSRLVPDKLNLGSAIRVMALQLDPAATFSC